MAMACMGLARFKQNIGFVKAQALKVHAAWRIYLKTIKWEDYEPNLVQEAPEIAASKGKDNWCLVGDLL